MLYVNEPTDGKMLIGVPLTYPLIVPTPLSIVISNGPIPPVIVTAMFPVEPSHKSKSKGKVAFVIAGFTVTSIES